MSRADGREQQLQTKIMELYHSIQSLEQRVIAEKDRALARELSNFKPTSETQTETVPECLARADWLTKTLMELLDAIIVNRRGIVIDGMH